MLETVILISWSDLCKIKHMWSIYKLTFPDLRIYIGQTSKNPKYRLTAYHSKRMRAEIERWGIDKIKIEILEICHTQEEAWEREIYWIKYYDSTNPYIGLNRSTGGRNSGSGVKKTDDEKFQLSIHNRGMVITEEEKQRLRKLRLGCPNTQEARDKMSKALRGLKKPKGWKEKTAQSLKGRKMSDEQKELMKNIRNGLSEIHAVNIKTGKVLIFHSLKECGDHFGYCLSTISNAIRDNRMIHDYLIKRVIHE